MRKHLAPTGSPETSDHGVKSAKEQANLRKIIIKISHAEVIQRGNPTEGTTAETGGTRRELTSFLFKAGEVSSSA